MELTKGGWICWACCAGVEWRGREEVMGGFVRIYIYI